MSGSKVFEFKEDDVEGLATLESIANADKLNEWMFNELAPFASGRVLEIGSGIGNISQFCIVNDWDITLSDIRDHYCDMLKEKFSTYKNLRGVLNIDLVHPDFEKLYIKQIGTYDFVFALNVVEHIEEHELALKNAKKLLTSTGRVFILVPAYQQLYNQFDKELYHYRRYTKKSLRLVMSKAGLKNEKSFYFNAAGIPGWVLYGGILKHKIIPSGQMKIFNSLVPIFKIIDKILLKKVGLSTITVAKK